MEQTTNIFSAAAMVAAHATFLKVISDLHYNYICDTERKCMESDCTCETLAVIISDELGTDEAPIDDVVNKIVELGARFVANEDFRYEFAVRYIGDMLIQAIAKRA